MSIVKQLATGNKILVEASPYDRIWGIGMRASDSRAIDPQQWLGQNLLGKALMQVREHIEMTVKHTSLRNRSLS